LLQLTETDIMPNPDKHAGAPETPYGRFNRRRIMVLIVVVFVIVLSFFAGRHFGKKPDYIQTGDPALRQYPGSDRVGIPPDSLPH
jgi:hypothetical protein